MFNHKNYNPFNLHTCEMVYSEFVPCKSFCVYAWRESHQKNVRVQESRDAW